MTVHYRVLGKGQPIVLLHGFGFNGEVWSSFATILTQTHQVYLVDLPGFGQSSFIQPEKSLWVNELLSVLPERFTLVGWSMGGTVAIAMAAFAPKRVKNLILFCTNPYFISSSTWPGMSRVMLERFFSRLENNFEKTINEFLFLQFDSKSLDKTTLRELQAMIKHCPPKHRALMAGQQILTQWDLRLAWSKLLIPVQVILGQLDSLVPKALAPHLVTSLPSVTLHLLDKAAHMPFISHRDRVLELIREDL